MYEGIIKFNCNWKEEKPLQANELQEINKWRGKLFKVGLIGAYKDGIGFGNISIRAENNSFIITGSGTGHMKNINENHFVTVTDYDLEKNCLTCKGPAIASSESLSHAVIYKCSPETNAVIHVHNLKMWKELLGKVPTTNKVIPYGTPEMANEIKRLFKESLVNEVKIIVMGGHEEGIISFGKTLEKAGGIILKKMRQLNNSNRIE